MTRVEDRVRSGLRAESQAIEEKRGQIRSTAGRQTSVMSGAGVAVGIGIAVLAIFGGVSLLTGPDSVDPAPGGSRDVATPSTSTSAPTATSIPLESEDGRFEAVPFEGANWEFVVTEEPQPSGGTYEVCFGLEPVGEATDPPAVGPPWCESWPKVDSRVSPYLQGIHYGLASNTSFVMVVELNDNPVAQVDVTGGSLTESLAPFTLPGSGKQFVVIEVPQSDGSIMVAALDENGTVLDQQEGAGRIPALSLEGTPIEDSTTSEIATAMGAEPISDTDLEMITGSVGFVDSGHLIASTTTADGAYELGLIVYREQPMFPFGLPMVCFSAYATTQGVNVAGGATCAETQEQAEDLSEFNILGGGTCGGIPKEKPRVEGVWTHLAIWGFPPTTQNVTVGIRDSTSVEVEVRDGVAIYIWEGSVDVMSIDFAGMTADQHDLISSYMPMAGIGADCGSGDTSGG